MAHYTDSVGFFKNSASYPAKTNNRVTLIEMTLDFNKIAAERAAAGLPALAAGDSLDVLQLPEKTLALAAGADITTAGTATLDVSLGIDGTPGHFLNAVDGGAVGSFGSASTALVYFADATNLRATLATVAPGDLKVRFWVLVCDTFGDLGDVPGTV
jgi:hypothetical protein